MPGWWRRRRVLPCRVVAIGRPKHSLEESLHLSHQYNTFFVTCLLVYRPCGARGMHVDENRESRAPGRATIFAAWKAGAGCPCTRPWRLVKGPFAKFIVIRVNYVRSMRRPLRHLRARAHGSEQLSPAAATS